MRSFKFFFVILAIGAVLCWISVPLTPAPMMKSLPGSISILKEPSLYVEIKAWASIVGQVMGGLGGLGLIVKTMVSLVQIIFKKKRGESI